MAEETTPQAAPEQDAPQAAETPQTEETTQEAAAEAPTANNAEDFLQNFNWHHYEEGIDVIEEKQLEEFEALVGKLMEDVTANEPGSIYDVRRVRGEPLTYLYFISFPDQAAYDRYISAEYHTEMSPKVMAMLDGDPVFEDLDSFK